MTFAEAYTRLNQAQKQAVDTIEGPVMVIAGPGTGKTQILATRIANILQKTDTAPSAILALTFTEAAAKNMQQRLISLIGSAAYSVHIQTFHAFCDSVIREHSEYFSFKQESQVLTDLERYALFEEILLQPRWEVLRTANSPFYYLKKILKAISDLKKEAITPEKLIELVTAEKDLFDQEKSELKKTELLKTEKKVAKMSELCDIFTLYQQHLQERHRYDYDDMVSLVLEQFKTNEDLLLTYQEKLSYFLVDEYQDTNSSQNQIIDLLASYWGDQANIFVVGDPNQSIYRFQGASLENTFSFLEKYSQAEVIQLNVGYRCPPSIYESAAAVIRHIDFKADLLSSFTEQKKHLLSQLSAPLKSVQTLDQKIQICPAATPQLEVIQVMNCVQELLKLGVKPSEIALLYRTNAEASQLISAMEQWKIPYQAESSSDALQNIHVQQLITLLTVIHQLRSHAEGVELYQLLNFSWVGLDQHAVMAVTRAAAETKMSIYERVQAGYKSFSKLQHSGTVTELSFQLIEEFIHKLEIWSSQDAEFAFPNWLQLVMTESGFLDFILKKQSALSELLPIAAFHREAITLASQSHSFHLSEFLSALQTMNQHQLKIAVNTLLNADNTVTLSTVHKAKGMEWEYVFLLNCVDGKWGNSKSSSDIALPDGILSQSLVTKQDQMDDDLRLFYVAMTRAKKCFSISYAEQDASAGKVKLLLPSFFIEYVPTEYKSYQLQLSEVSEIEQRLAMLLSKSREREFKEMEREWLKHVLEDFHLSASSLNSYLRSPKEFYEDYILKVPRISSEQQAFGTAIHGALEATYRQLMTAGEHLAYDSLFQVFEKTLLKQPLTNQTFEQLRKQGQQLLESYRAQLFENVVNPLFVEKSFGIGWSTTQLGDISLHGRIDRIDWLDDEKKKVRVVDYKTGRPKTMNEILGKVGIDEYSERELALPESIRGQYKRQLVFYKLLTDLDKSFGPTATVGILDFVKPNSEGKFTRREVALLDEDVEDLKKLILEVMAEIRSLKFIDEFTK